MDPVHSLSIPWGKQHLPGRAVVKMQQNAKGSRKKKMPRGRKLHMADTGDLRAVTAVSSKAK